MKYITLFLLLCFCRCYAQFNDTTNYYVNYSSTGIINKTNESNSYVLNNNVRFNIYKKHISVNTTNAWIFGKQRNALSNNDFSSIADVNLFKSDKHVYYWGLANYEKSYSLKINYRIQSGIGVGYYVIDRNDLMVQVSDGILYEKADLKDTETSINDYQTIRNSFRLKFRVLMGKIAVLESSDFLQHAIADRKDYIIKSNTTLSLKLQKWLSFTAALTYNKLNRTDRENLLCNFGLTLERYF